MNSNSVNNNNNNNNNSISLIPYVNFNYIKDLSKNLTIPVVHNPIYLCHKFDNQSPCQYIDSSLDSEKIQCQQLWKKICP
jgi:hypothetical protein